MKKQRKQNKRLEVSLIDLQQAIIDVSSREQMRLISKEFSAKDVEQITNIIIQESNDIKNQYYSTNIEIKMAKDRTFTELLKKFLVKKTHNMYA